MQIKIIVCGKEMEEIDCAVGKGYGKNRADLCRKAVISYLEDYDGRTETGECRA